MAACAKCGAPLLEGAGFCGSCGAPVGAPAAAPPSGPAVGGGAAGPAVSATAGASGLTPNVAGALAYFTIIPAIIFLVVEPYNKDRFIKFHSFQCLFLAAGSIALFMVMGILGIIPFLGWAILLLMPFVGLGIFALVVYTMYQAYNRNKFMIPVIGKLADQQAAK